MQPASMDNLLKFFAQHIQATYQEDVGQCWVFHFLKEFSSQELVDSTNTYILQAYFFAIPM